MRRLLCRRVLADGKDGSLVRRKRSPSLGLLGQVHVKHSNGDRLGASALHRARRGKFRS